MHISNGWPHFSLVLRNAIMSILKKTVVNICELVTRSWCFGGKLRITNETQLCFALWVRYCEKLLCLYVTSWIIPNESGVSNKHDVYENVGIIKNSYAKTTSTNQRVYLRSEKRKRDRLCRVKSTQIQLCRNATQISYLEHLSSFKRHLAVRFPVFSLTRQDFFTGWFSRSVLIIKDGWNCIVLQRCFLRPWQTKRVQKFVVVKEAVRFKMGRT